MNQAQDRSRQRKKILISAYACDPGRGSEPGVGWHLVRQMSRFEQVWVITRANNRGPIEAAVASEPLPNTHFVYFDLPRWIRFWKRGQAGILLYYYLWQVGVYFIARKSHREVGFDLVHHLTFSKYWTPSFLVLLPVPFLWGPVGGGDAPPPAFWGAFSLKGILYETMRNIARGLGELDPFVRLTARRSALVLANTQGDHRKVRSLGARNVHLFSHMGMETRLGGQTPKLFAHKRFRIVSLGRFLQWKGFDLGLRAFALLQRQYPASEYWLIGDGPERKRLEKLSVHLGVSDWVKFSGSMPRADALACLTQCDVLLHPSLYDSAPSACLEAMAAQLPIVCLNVSGPALQVTETSGIRIAARTPEQVVGDLAVALGQLAGNTALLRSLAQGARERVEANYDWDRKGEQLAAIYDELIRPSDSTTVCRGFGSVKA
jgi:glycosyltransferase involved in cell wall biosynthesis